jgi:DNA primase
LKYGIKNTIAVGGTNVPPTVKKISNEKVVTAFVDGDRGGELILRELFQVAEIDFVARAPKSLEVEELTQKQIIKSLRNKIPIEQFLEMNDMLDLSPTKDNGEKKTPAKKGSVKSRDRPDKREQTTKAPQPKEKPKETPKAPIKAATSSEKKKAPQPPSDMNRYKDILKTLSGTLRAMLLNDNGEVVQELAVRQLADTLKSPPKGINAVVFDGIISQRLLDIASEQGIKFLVGSKKGNLTKEPEDVLVLSRDDLNA